MRNVPAYGAALVVLLCLRCATPGSERGPSAADEFHATGSVLFSNGSASFDEGSVIGPRITMTRRDDGSWMGHLDGHPLDVSVYPSRVVGVDLTLTIERSTQGYVVHGQYQGRIFRIELDERRLLIGFPDDSLDLQRRGRNDFADARVHVRLDGTAADVNPPWPQLPLAMLATF